MAGLDVITVQDNILAYIDSQFPNYEVVEDEMLDNESVLRQGNKVKPYIVLRWGGLWRTGSTAMAGVRYDEYSSTVDVAIIAPVPKQARRGLNAVMDTLIGWKPAGGGVLVPSGASTVITVPDEAGRPQVYIASSRLVFTVNGEDVGAHISH